MRDRKKKKGRERERWFQIFQIFRLNDALAPSWDACHTFPEFYVYAFIRKMFVCTFMWRVCTTTLWACGPPRLPIMTAAAAAFRAFSDRRNAWTMDINIWLWSIYMYSIRYPGRSPIKKVFIDVTHLRKHERRVYIAVSLMFICICR